MQLIDQANIPIAQEMASTLRMLCCDMIQKAGSGHPGVALGLSDVAVVLSTHLLITPMDPMWINRDRLVFSGGHASALAYSLLHLWGFEVSLEDLRNFRQLGSKTPGHPESIQTPGIEVTTGPLGQGIANAVGLSMASKRAKEILGECIDHYVYCLCGDGDLQEGISYEACSLAGHLKLDNLILIYDSNKITIEGEISLSMSEDVIGRFASCGWDVLICDGHNFLDIDRAIRIAKTKKKPCLIIANTIIGKGASGLEGDKITHGSPLGEEIIENSKKNLGLDPKKFFFISPKIQQAFRNSLTHGLNSYNHWNSTYSQNSHAIQRFLDLNLQSIQYPLFKKGEQIPTRTSNGMILNHVSSTVKNLIGGSADLGPSNNTILKDQPDFPRGNNIHFGIREHAMGGISNGIAAYGLFIPFCSTFFVFSDYLIPSIRIASLMHSKILYFFTHDSIGVGEDGATHQPIEQLSHLRSMPNIIVFRPADANENVACFKFAIQHEGPSVFILSRQNIEVITQEPSENIKYGAYIIKENHQARITLLASGSEVQLALQSAQTLENEGIPTQVISAPSFDLLIKQSKAYLEKLFVGKVLAIEAARSFEWYKFADDVLMMEGFGASGKGSELFEYFGFTPQKICARAKKLLA